MSRATTLEPRRAAASCPGCGKPGAAAFRPFCSAGCRDRDLLKWLSDDYRIPGPPAGGSEDLDDGRVDS